MSNLEVFTIAEQVANHLRQEIQRGLLQGLMPGRNELATQLGFNGKTIEAALKLLERGGVLQSQGPGRKRRIVEADKLASRATRIAILDYEPLNETEAYTIEMRHLLAEAGHLSFLPINPCSSSRWTCAESPGWWSKLRRTHGSSAPDRGRC